MSLLIKDATIVTQDAARRIVRGSILIGGGAISQVGEVNEGADTVIDAKGKIAMPGLVNMHTHVGMTVLRGYGEGLPLQRWLNEKIWPAEARQTADDAAAGARLAFCEMIRGGTTTFAEMCIHPVDGVFKAAMEAGMRGRIGRGLMDFNHPEWIPKIIKEVEASLQLGGGMLLPFVGAHAPYTCSEELLMKAKELARRNDLPFQMHVAETRKEVFDVLKARGKYPFEYLDSIGLMDSSSIFAHGNWLTKREMGIAGRAGITVAACPVSGLKLAVGGIAQLAELDALGANVTLGTDGAASNNSLDMFQTMKMSSLLQSHHYWKADALIAQKALDFSTINGAKALGFNSGSIEPGKEADIIILERGPNMHPEHDLVANLVYSAGPQNVSEVVIGGKIIMQGRRILTIDEAAAIHDAEGAAKRIAAV